ncbi:hypothetical protein RFI_14453 [Reticulomyxa filosa]|uniref:Uncharacterized protein n=1 Tax=Reticulomyxa filosa TaxID=46433 RepID=X6N9M1_RETFI|nr:hypothetical protein RFI_14453 [Reticulomyxa filosa]|eukprot:ETO22741.1 hypothetical protein RFI_14453 [Reticulomyxa filosa]
MKGVFIVLQTLKKKKKHFSVLLIKSKIKHKKRSDAAEQNFPNMIEQTRKYKSKKKFTFIILLFILESNDMLLKFSNRHSTQVNKDKCYFQKKYV